MHEHYHNLEHDHSEQVRLYGSICWVSFTPAISINHLGSASTFLCVVYLEKLSLGLEVMNSLQAEAKPAKPRCYYQGGILDQWRIVLLAY